MRDRNARGDVFGEEQFFHRDLVRRKAVEQGVEPLFEHGKAHRQVLLFGRCDDAVIFRLNVAARILAQYSVSERGDARIDP